MPKRKKAPGPGRRAELNDTLDRPIPPEVYPVVDTDLGRDNLENDLTEADKQDL